MPYPSSPLPSLGITASVTRSHCPDMSRCITSTHPQPPSPLDNSSLSLPSFEATPLEARIHHSSSHHCHIPSSGTIPIAHCHGGSIHAALRVVLWLLRVLLYRLHGAQWPCLQLSRLLLFLLSATPPLGWERSG
jgi:hypothetical protein